MVALRNSSSIFQITAAVLYLATKLASDTEMWCASDMARLADISTAVLLELERGLIVGVLEFRTCISRSEYNHTKFSLYIKRDIINTTTTLH